MTALAGRMVPRPAITVIMEQPLIPSGPSGIAWSRRHAGAIIAWVWFCLGLIS